MVVRVEKCMPSYNSIIDAMLKEASDQFELAYRILGAKPGPGIDILIYPVQPLCGRWMVTGLTPAGRNFIKKFWYRSIETNRDLAQFKHEAIHWQLKYRTEYPITSMEA